MRCIWPALITSPYQCTWDVFDQPWLPPFISVLDMYLTQKWHIFTFLSHFSFAAMGAGKLGLVLCLVVISWPHILLAEVCYHLPAHLQGVWLPSVEPDVSLDLRANSYQLKSSPYDNPERSPFPWRQQWVEFNSLTCDNDTGVANITVMDTDTLQCISLQFITSVRLGMQVHVIRGLTENVRDCAASISPLKRASYLIQLIKTGYSFVSTFEPRGCFEIIGNISLQTSAYSSVTTITSFCASQYFGYALINKDNFICATGSPEEVFGRSDNVTVLPQILEDCSWPCSGDNGEICGGDKHLYSLYEFTNVDAILTRELHVGCYIRDNPSHISEFGLFGCLQTCATHRFYYAQHRANSECSCVPSYGHTGPSADNTCSGYNEVDVFSLHSLLKNTRCVETPWHFTGDWYDPLGNDSMHLGSSDVNLTLTHESGVKQISGSIRDAWCLDADTYRFVLHKGDTDSSNLSHLKCVSLWLDMSRDIMRMRLVDFGDDLLCEIAAANFTDVTERVFWHYKSGKQYLNKQMVSQCRSIPEYRHTGRELLAVFATCWPINVADTSKVLSFYSSTMNWYECGKLCLSSLKRLFVVYGKHYCRCVQSYKQLSDDTGCGSNCSRSSQCLTASETRIDWCSTTCFTAPIYGTCHASLPIHHYKTISHVHVHAHKNSRIKYLDAFSSYIREHALHNELLHEPQVGPPPTLTHQPAHIIHIDDLLTHDNNHVSVDEVVRTDTHMAKRDTNGSEAVPLDMERDTGSISFEAVKSSISQEENIVYLRQNTRGDIGCTDDDIAFELRAGMTRWSHHGGAALTSSQMEITETGGLVISDPQPKDSGRYTCHVLGQAGETLHNFIHVIHVYTVSTLHCAVTIRYKGLLCDDYHRIEKLEILTDDICSESECAFQNFEARCLKLVDADTRSLIDVLEVSMEINSGSDFDTPDCDLACINSTQLSTVDSHWHHLVEYLAAADENRMPMDPFTLLPESVTHKLVRTCQPGYHLQNGICIACKPGMARAHTGSTCRPCPRGSYQPAYASIACDSCPDGTNTTKPGAKFHSECEEMNLSVIHLHGNFNSALIWALLPAAIMLVAITVATACSHMRKRHTQSLIMTGLQKLPFLSLVASEVKGPGPVPGHTYIVGATPEALLARRKTLHHADTSPLKNKSVSTDSFLGGEKDSPIPVTLKAPEIIIPGAEESVPGLDSNPASRGPAATPTITRTSAVNAEVYDTPTPGQDFYDQCTTPLTKYQTTPSSRHTTQTPNLEFLYDDVQDPSLHSPQVSPFQGGNTQSSTEANYRPSYTSSHPRIKAVAAMHEGTPLSYRGENSTPKSASRTGHGSDFKHPSLTDTPSMAGPRRGTRYSIQDNLSYQLQDFLHRPQPAPATAEECDDNVYQMIDDAVHGGHSEA